MFLSRGHCPYISFANHKFQNKQFTRLSHATTIKNLFIAQTQPGHYGAKLKINPVVHVFRQTVGPH